MTIRCVIVDDNSAFLKAARRLLERQGVDVVGVATTSAEAVACIASTAPDVVLVDVGLGEESGFDLARRLDGSTAVVLISTQSEADLEELVAETPAVGFVSKADLSASALRRLLAGA